MMETTFEIQKALTEKVKIIANKYYRMSNCIDYSEYLDAGMKGLFRAIQKFDPARKCRLANYAEYRIRGEIKDMVRSRAKYMATTVSLDELLEMSEDGFFSQSDIADDPVRAIQRAIDVNTILMKLNRDFREILYLYYWRGLTNKDIGDLMRVTGEWASKKRKKALRWFRFYYVFG